MTQALLIIDIQNDYFPGGAMELRNSLDAAHRAGELLAAFRHGQRPVLHVQHHSIRPGATYLRPGTAGAAIHPAVAPSAGEPVFVKHYPNSFRDTGLLDYLQTHGINQLVVAGMMTHMCVDTTVRAAFDLGLACTLAHDACATRDLVFGDRTVAAIDVHAAYMAALAAVFAEAKSTEEIIDAMNRA